MRYQNRADESVFSCTWFQHPLGLPCRRSYLGTCKKYRHRRLLVGHFNKRIGSRGMQERWEQLADHHLGRILWAFLGTRKLVLNASGSWATRGHQIGTSCPISNNCLFPDSSNNIGSKFRSHSSILLVLMVLRAVPLDSRGDLSQGLIFRLYLWFHY